MKIKVGTILDEELLLKSKQTALAQKKTLSQFLEDALKVYLLMMNEDQGKKNKNIVGSTKGSMKISKTRLKAIMEEEGLYDV